MFKVKRFLWHCSFTPGNVVRGNQNNDNEILTGASGHELRTVDRMLTNLLSRYLPISKRENRQLGNVVLNSFHFYTRLVIKIRGKSSCQLLICLLVWVKFIPLHLALDQLNKKSAACLSMSNHFFFGAEINVFTTSPDSPKSSCKHVKMMQEQEHSPVYLHFLMPWVMAGCTRKDFLSIAFGFLLRHYQACPFVNFAQTGHFPDFRLLWRPFL